MIAGMEGIVTNMINFCCDILMNYILLEVFFISWTIETTGFT